MRRDELQAVLFLIYTMACALLLVNMPAIFRALNLI